MPQVSDLITQAEQLSNEVVVAIKNVQNLQALDQLEHSYLSKKGSVTYLSSQVRTCSQQDKPRAGQAIHRLKNTLREALQSKRKFLEQQQLEQRLQHEKIDVTRPGYRGQTGCLHPITQVLYRLEDIFVSMGFSVASSSEIEDDYHNFSALNIPEYHPARAMHDTVYLQGGHLLRTHTSPVQIRVMQQSQPPLQIITYGRTYRHDTPDATHSPMFHQLEALWVDEQVTFSDLKGLVYEVLQSFFDCPLKIRFRASYFPFTEPSAEVDLQCLACQGKGCSSCSHSGWIEVLGCGMVHPHVLSGMNINTERYTGLALGAGPERLAMLLYGIHDLRCFFSNDWRFLGQFSCN